MRWYEKFSDSDYTYGRALSQVTGTLVMRLADASVLPFQFRDTADTLLRYVEELEKLAQTKKDSKVDLGRCAPPSSPSSEPARRTRRRTRHSAASRRLLSLVAKSCRG